MQMQELTTEKNGIHDDQEYHDLSERLRIIDRAIVQLIMIKEEYEYKIKEYLKYRQQDSI
jgi:hypothetical protein